MHNNNNNFKRKTVGFLLFNYFVFSAVLVYSDKMAESTLKYISVIIALLGLTTLLINYFL